MFYSRQDLFHGVPRKERLHAEEIRIVDWCKDRLVDCDFRCEGQDFRGVVEVVSQEHEPFVTGNSGASTNYESSQSSCGIVLIDGDALR